MSLRFSFLFVPNSEIGSNGTLKGERYGISANKTGKCLKIKKTNKSIFTLKRQVLRKLRTVVDTLVVMHIFDTKCTYDVSSYSLYGQITPFFLFIFFRWVRTK